MTDTTPDNDVVVLVDSPADQLGSSPPSPPTGTGLG
jgi:hypothetical protein